LLDEIVQARESLLVRRAGVEVRRIDIPVNRRVAESAVLSANYLAARIKDEYELPFAGPYAHEFIAVPPFREHGVTELDVAKRLIDYGIHPPTMSWPVPHCLMIEPTETESLATLDAFADAMIAIAGEARQTPELLHKAPTTMPVYRLDEVAAARKPDLRWRAAAPPADSPDPAGANDPSPKRQRRVGRAERQPGAGA